MLSYYKKGYLENDRYKYITKSKNIDELIDYYNAELISRCGLKKAGKLNAQPDNIAFISFAYNDIKSVTYLLNSITNHARNVDSYLDEKREEIINVNDSYGMNDLKQRLKQTELYTTIDKNCKLLESLLKDMYDFGYSEETEILRRLTGDKFLGRAYVGNMPLPYLLNGINWRPSENSPYILEGLKSMQTVSGGILANGSYPYNTPAPIFLYTDDIFIDGQWLNNVYAYYVGTFKYNSAVGMRHVYAFRQYKLEKVKKLKNRKQYFYPEIVYDDTQNVKYGTRIFGTSGQDAVSKILEEINPHQ